MEHLNLFFKSSLTERNSCVLSVYSVFAFCALLSKHVCGTGKGVTGMLLFRQRKDMAQRPRQLLWDVVKYPYHR